MPRDSRKNKEETELKERVISINRVSKVAKGGKSFSFSSLVVVGNARGLVGVGLGKANEVPDSIKKAIARAKRNVIEVQLVNGTVTYEAKARYGASEVMLKPASSGTGVIAGGAVRAILESLGVKNILTKSLGSNNAHNISKATISALMYIEDQRKFRCLRQQA